MRVRNYTLILLFLTSTLILGCRKSENADSNTVIVAIGSKPSTLDPRFATDAYGMRLTSLLFSSLVFLGPELKIVGDAAHTWTYKNLTYTFQLKPNLIFSNGEPVTAEDILYSFAQFKDRKSPHNSSFSMIENVEAKYDENDRFVRIRLSSFSAALLNDLSTLKFLPRKLVEANDNGFSQNPIGSGPFKLLQSSASDITLEARPNSGIAYKNLIFRVIADENTRYLKMLKGEIDIAQNEIPSYKIFYIENRRKDLMVYKAPGLTMNYMLLNHEDPALKKREVRLAIAHAVNRDEIIQYKLDNLSAEATSILSARNPYQLKGMKNPEYNPEKAKQLLAAAGYPNLTIALKTSNAQVAVENGKVLTNQLAKAGIQVRHQSFEWGTFFSDVSKGNFHAATMRWVGNFDPDIYRTFLHSKEVPPGRNRGRYSNPTLDQLLEDGLKIDNESVRISHYKKVQEMVHEDMPFIPLWYDLDVAVVNPRIKGYVLSSTADYRFALNISKAAK